MIIVDEGDGFFDATLSGIYIEKPEDKVLTLGADGEGDTGLILPDDVEWFLTEVFDVEGVVYDIGLTAYSSDVSSLLTDIEALRQEAIIAYGTFTITTVHYKTANIADIYQGSEEYTHCLAKAYTNISFNPSASSWKLTRETTSTLFSYILYPALDLYPLTCLYPQSV